MIQAINLNKIYKTGASQLHVLKDINLKIDKGEFVAIVGPSGAGKSTLLHILGGLDTPTSGRIFFDKTDLCKINDSERAKLRNARIGFVFQFYHLMPEFSAFENVAMPALIRGKAFSYAKASGDGQGLRVKEKIENRARQLLMMLGLGDRIGHRPNQLSGGEQQRVAIARALMNSPSVLYCDEPTGNLDSKTGSEVIEALLKLNKDNSATCVMVTHEEYLARDADRVLHMMDGRIL